MGNFKDDFYRRQYPVNSVKAQKNKVEYNTIQYNDKTCTAP